MMNARLLSRIYLMGEGCDKAWEIAGCPGHSQRELELRDRSDRDRIALKGFFCSN